MLTIEKLKEMKQGVFNSGTVSDNSVGINMANSGKLLRWVAVRGAIYDWAIYCHWADKPIEWVARHGDKIHFEEHIKKLIECNDEAFQMYRN